MLGIDIIDLEDPLFKKRNDRTLKFITNSGDEYKKDENAFWYLWVAKEAIFKTKRELLPFTPKEIPVQILETNREITFSSGNITGRIFRYGQVILAVAVDAGADLADIDFDYFKKNDGGESHQARIAIEESISSHYNRKVSVTHDGNGLPVLSFKSLPVSISHHGNYIAYAYPGSNLKD